MKKHLLFCLLPLLATALVSCDGSDPISLVEDLADDVGNAFDDVVDEVEDLIDGGEEEIREARLTEITLLDDATLTFNSPLDGGFPYDQQSIPLLPQAVKYEIRFELTTQNVAGSDHDFTVLLDTPQVRSFDIHGAESGQDFSLFIPGSLTPTEFLEFQDTRYTIEQVVDLEQNRWTIRVNGSLIYDGIINADTVEDIRFSFGGFIDIHDPSRSATVEELTIRAYVPSNTIL